MWGEGVGAVRWGRWERWGRGFSALSSLPYTIYGCNGCFLPSKMPQNGVFPAQGDYVEEKRKKFAEIGIKPLKKYPIYVTIIIYGGMAKFFQNRWLWAVIFPRIDGACRAATSCFFHPFGSRFDAYDHPPMVPTVRFGTDTRRGVGHDTPTDTKTIYIK